MLRRLIGYLSSRDLAYKLMLVLVALLIIGSFFPHPAYQDVHSSEWQEHNRILWWIMQTLRFEYIFQAWFFYVLVGVFLVNTSLCTVLQIKRSIGLSRVTPGKATVVKGSLAVAQRLLRSQGFKLVGHEDGMEAVKGKASLWGMVIFHSSFLLIAIGVLVGQLFSFDGRILLTEGQWLEDRASSYLYLNKSPLIADPHTYFQMGLTKVHTKGEKEAGKTVSSNYLTFVDSKGKTIEGLSKTGLLFRYKDYAFFTDDSGYSPFIRISQSGNPQRQIEGFIPLMNRGTTQEELVQLGEREIGLEYTEGKLTFATDSGSITLNQGQAGTLGDLQVAFVEVRRWTSFVVIKDYGVPLIFYSSWFGIIGALLFYLKPFVKVRLWMSTTGLEVAVASNRNSIEHGQQLIKLLNQGEEVT